MNIKSWLKGWELSNNNTQVIIINECFCSGCGRSLGLISIVYSPETIYPNQLPDWPFYQGDCPICVYRPIDTTLKNATIEQIRLEIKNRKSK